MKCVNLELLSLRRVSITAVYEIYLQFINGEHNKQMLQKLSSIIEENSKLASEYARITTVNTDTIAWIQTLDFLIK